MASGSDAPPEPLKGTEAELTTLDLDAPAPAVVGGRRPEGGAPRAEEDDPAAADTDDAPVVVSTETQDEMLAELEVLEHTMSNPCEVLTSLVHRPGGGGAPASSAETTPEGWGVRARLGGVVQSARGLITAVTTTLAGDEADAPKKKKPRDYSAVAIAAVAIAPARGPRFSSASRGTAVNGSAAASALPALYALTTKARYEGHAGIEVTIGGGSLTRRIEDFDWLRRALRDEHAGCVVPPLPRLASFGGGPSAVDAASKRVVGGGAGGPPAAAVQQMLLAMSPGGGAVAAATGLERFVRQCLDHPELAKSPQLAAFCAAEPTELEEAKQAFATLAAQKPPLYVRVGALLLDVVGDATPIDLDYVDDDDDEAAASDAAAATPDASSSSSRRHAEIVAKRREADVRELYAWAKEQATAMAECERECAEGAAALLAFERATEQARRNLTSRFSAAAESPGADAAPAETTTSVAVVADAEEAASSAAAPPPPPPPTESSSPTAGTTTTTISGPAKALNALGDMVGLARALCEAIESRERSRLRLVAAKNALGLAKASEAARRAMLDAARAQRDAAKALDETAVAVVERHEAEHRRRGERPELFGHALPGELSELDAPIIDGPAPPVQTTTTTTPTPVVGSSASSSEEKAQPAAETTDAEESSSSTAIVVASSPDDALEREAAGAPGLDALVARAKVAWGEAPSRDDVRAFAAKYLATTADATLVARDKARETWATASTKIRGVIADVDERFVDRDALVTRAKARAAHLGAMGLTVVSRVALGAAAASASTDDVARAKELVARLNGEFKAADARLRVDAPTLKRKWDDLQYQAFESFAIGEQARADLARSAADGAALDLAAARTTRSGSAADGAAA